MTKDLFLLLSHLTSNVDNDRIAMSRQGSIEFVFRPLKNLHKRLVSEGFTQVSDAFPAVETKK